MMSMPALPTIVVINDNGMLINAIRDVFTQEGFSVVAAPASAFDGPYALIEYCQAHDAPIVVFDIGQPYEGHWQAFKAVHEAAREAGMHLIVTSIDRWGLAGRDVPEDVIDVLVMPLDLRELVKLVLRVVEAGDSPRE